MILKSLSLVIFLLIFSNSVWALAPIESLVLGNFSENYSENITDPLNYVFTRDKNQSVNLSFKKELALYRGFYEEGRNTLNFCKNSKPIRYASEWDKTQVVRSILAEIQYVGLDLLSRSIPQYAKSLEFNSEEYSNLIENLVGNYCSTNISVISKKEIINNFKIKFDKENNFRLPSVDGNPFFSNQLDKILPPKKSLEQEFKFSIKLFQALCSWSGDANNAGLMVPILRNPAIMAFIFRQLNNQELDWKEIDNTIGIKSDNQTVQVWCENLICRKTNSKEEFLSKIPFSVGGTSLSDDYKRLYCENFRSLDYKPKELDERLAKIIKSRTLDEEIFVNSQFIALVTGVPDFLLRAEKFSQGDDLIRSSMDYNWNEWSKVQFETLNRELYFEEPLSIELVDHTLFFNGRTPKYRVALDINLGELDRVNQRIGKVRVGFNLNIQRSFLHFYRNSLSNLNASQKSERDRLLKRFKLQISNDVASAREKFIIPPWKGDIESLIASEITSQIEEVADRNFKIPEKGIEIIPVELNYGTFALKYIHHQKNILKNSEKNKESSSK